MPRRNVPALTPSLQDFRDQADQRRMHGLQPAGTAHVAGAAAILVVEQQDEVRMRGKVVERALDQLADGPFRRQARQIELALLGADFLVNPFQHGEVERVLVAEVMVDQLLVDPGARGDFVDPGAGKAAAGKFAPCRGQQLLAAWRPDRAAAWLAVCVVFSAFPTK